MVILNLLAFKNKKNAQLMTVSMEMVRLKIPTRKNQNARIYIKTN